MLKNSIDFIKKRSAAEFSRSGNVEGFPTRSFLSSSYMYACVHIGPFPNAATVEIVKVGKGLLVMIIFPLIQGLGRPHVIVNS